MAITVKWVGPGLLAAMDAGIDFDGATHKLALVTATETPDRDADDFWDDASANEVANGDGYSTGGVTLASITTTYDSASDQIRLDHADPSWTFTASKAWRYAYHYVDTAGASSTDPILLLYDWGTTQTVEGVYTLTIDAAGIAYIDTT